MACFIVPATEAVVTTVMRKVVQHKERLSEQERQEGAECCQLPEVRFSEKLHWLNQMLWGGSALLAFEHLWHGEISPFFPFLTAAGSQKELAEMFQEMGTTGVGMAVLVTVVWGVMVMFTGERKGIPSGEKNIQNHQNVLPGGKNIPRCKS